MSKGITRKKGSKTEVKTSNNICQAKGAKESGIARPKKGFKSCTWRLGGDEKEGGKPEFK